MSTIQIIINPEYEKIVPKVPEAEYNKLKESILQDGQWVPIIINSENVVLDGHHRLRVCNELEISPKISRKSFNDKIKEKEFVIECNLRRRHLTPYQVDELGMELLKIEEARAKERHGNQYARGSSDPEADFGRAAEKIADKINRPLGTFKRSIQIHKKATEEVKQELREGTKTITSAYNELNNKSKVEKQESLPLPKGKHQLLYVDPPWFYGNFHNSYDTGKTAAELYNVMNDDQLKNLKVPEISSDDSVLLMWVTYPCLEQGLQLIKDWGFTYRTVAFTWVKKNKSGEGYFFGLGNYTRANAEICLLAVKGKGLTVKSHKVEQVCDAPLTIHSEKPDEIRDRIVELFGDVKRVELFARKKVKGWKSWGDEI